MFAATSPDYIRRDRTTARESRRSARLEQTGQDQTGRARSVFKSPLGHTSLDTKPQAAGHRPAARVIRMSKGRLVTLVTSPETARPIQLSCARLHAEDQCCDPVGGVGLQRSQHVTVDVESDADGRVPEPLLDHLRVHTGLECQRRPRVSETMHGQWRQTMTGDLLGERSGEPLGVPGPAIGPREDRSWST